MQSQVSSSWSGRGGPPFPGSSSRGEERPGGQRWFHTERSSVFLPPRPCARSPSTWNAPSTHPYLTDSSSPDFRSSSAAQVRTCSSGNLRCYPPGFRHCLITPAQLRAPRAGVRHREPSDTQHATSRLRHHHLGTGEKGSVSGPMLDAPNQNLHLHETHKGDACAG